MPTYEQTERIIALLEEIRSRMPKLPPPSRPPMLFGYEAGQDRPPNDAQVAMARELLAGKWSEDRSVQMMPKLAFDLAQEIVSRS